MTRVGHGVDLRVDLAAVEEPLEIRIDGERFVTTMRTPGADKDLAAGLLLAERIVHAATDIRSIDQVDQATVDVRLNAEAAARPYRIGITATHHDDKRVRGLRPAGD